MEVFEVLKCEAMELERASEVEERLLFIERIECLFDYIEDIEHLNIKPHFKDNKIFYVVNNINYFIIECIDKDKYIFNGCIEGYLFEKVTDGLDAEFLIDSIFSIIKNYGEYKVLDKGFTSQCISIYQCLDISIEELKKVIARENIEDITLESNLITLYKDSEVLMEVDIKSEVTRMRFTNEEQESLLRYYYDKLEQNNIKYSIIA